ncbi:putative short-chain dehydrogenase [Annulohypoxylon truncatum]|uniref:putative short-chain dehydrogenase n=1 Tax=Annulohypoxylon truncatum TaxID=327061 RepID=UPI002008C6B7|nr:putative short-chain dehydrogenase [Annulohypoxylon truncatum]KAI1213587.1 putative short-chain dehydrogenase [Annulohypoxylon truncatum]
MAGTVILTGANGSVGIPAAERLLNEYPQLTCIFTVRNAEKVDNNTQNLRQVIARCPDAKASIYQVDFANLSAVHEFASTMLTAIETGKYPALRSIICCASYWNLVGDSELTTDGYDKTLQVNHIAHVILVLRLIGSFASDGRIVLFSSIGHYRKPNAMTSYLPDIPDDIDLLNHPPSGKDKHDLGFQRYANSKLVITTWMYPLNRYLQQNPRFKNITAVAINPGGLGDSRCFTTNTARSTQLAQRFVLKPFMSMIRYLADPTFRSSAEAAVDVIKLAVDKAYQGEQGYFTLLQKDDSDPITMDESVQQRVWQKSLEWAKITKNNTALKNAIE